MPFDEPNMSDNTLLVSVEDLINIAMGPEDKNIVNFKVIQTVLHILARQQRMLQQRVEIRITEVRPESPPPARAPRKSKKGKESEGSSPSSSPRTSPPKKRVATPREDKPKDTTKVDKEKVKTEKDSKKREEKEKAKLEKEREKELRAQEKAEKSARKEQEKAEKAQQRELEKAQKEKEKAERLAGKEKEKTEKLVGKEKERAERLAEKEKDKTERAASKEREKAERAASKEREKEERSASKEREKAERAASKEREKEERSASKEREKAERAASKEREKEERSASKEREKAERSASKEREKAERAASKEREKEERAASKEKEKAERAASKEREKAEKAEIKEKERAEKEAAKAQKGKERSERSPLPAATKDKKKSRVEAVPSINISEVERGKEKVLVVEKGPTTRSETRARGSIDVVTQSQFALLEAAVQGLMEKAAPMAELRMPDNQNLKSALVKGSASLTDTMQAMQVNARVKAAEEAIDRMAGLLTQLAAAGAVPEALADRVAEAKREAERILTSDTDDNVPVKPRPSTARKSVAIDPMVKTSELARPSTATAARGSSAPTPRASISTVMGRASVMSQPSSTVTALPDPKVTREEMEDIIKSVKDDLWKKMNAMTTKATSSAETAMHTAKAVADRLEVALKLDARISAVHSLVSDYAEQLGGFDAGLTTQMQSFQEQMVQIRSDLAGGLKLLESVNNNAETAAVMELTERYEELVSELDRTMSAHRSLADFQGQLGDELRSLVECVEMLREQKADRDEVIDGLRDKADTSRLAGLLTEAEFALARAELNRRLEVCHDKFQRQDGVWMGAIKELLKTTDLKAEIIDLLSMREDTQWQLRELHSKLQLLAAVLGEPKAALLTRQLARDATCGACGAAALMGMKDPSTGVPPAIPALRPPPPQEEPCLRDLKDWMPPEPADDRHICLRWCGGSHTLLSERTTREPAPPLELLAPPTRKFADYGRDGRLYMLEEELQPCKECNVVLEAEREPPVGEEGAGDRETRKTTIP